MDLPRWPHLLVTGEDVTPEQANDILLRTAPDHLWARDWRAVQAVAEVFGVPCGPARVDDAGFLAVLADLDHLPLEFLTNERILSTHPIGPHGWCDWNGAIGCDFHAIGPDPSLAALTAETDAIAAAWPFLHLDLQLCTASPDGTYLPLAHWSLRGGRAAMAEPEGLLTEPYGPWRPGHYEDDVPYVAMGVTVDRLAEALAQVRARP
ncbi:hypothetical protein [Actinocorallia herbida]|uniref:hypothetical protein n=1 Tax=Actinocorallia herbida TaxID=58109 RepID=UPI0011CE02CB|nr:hypothetical protein [Actinocorallia herbida]